MENTKSGTKQSEDLHRFCWLHFCKEVLGSLLKVCHRTGVASSYERLSSTYVSLGLNPFTTQSYLDILQPLSKYEARMGDLIGNNDGSTNSPCRLQTSSGNSSFTGFHDFKLVLKQDQSNIMINHVSSVFFRLIFCASHWILRAYHTEY